ncbi:MAG: DegT/DnrJ/EryC1/StrS family aminotransferase [Bacteroidales bacterium]|jgi:dTDP-4-amino-4,6-dideoxygalactose transaminase|nr:DegT/DnrJ/EryC1/StrS family aminotransferase [Bacteroidales bacterium]
MGKRNISRRQAISTASAGVAGALITWPLSAVQAGTFSQDKLAVTGGTKVHTGGWPTWPVWDQSAESRLTEMFRSGRWWLGRGEHVAEFEKQYAALMGAKRCLATASGTTALITAMGVLGVDAGDEVLVSPYTFIATYNAIFFHKALPVFVDTDPETFLIDPSKIEARITDRSVAILPVHIYGLPADMDGINAVAAKHGLKVVEDACQAWLAEYRGKKVGTLGDLGCFSFQNSKHLPAGEGGAILGNDDELVDRCHAAHNCGRPYGSMKQAPGYPSRGGNFRMQQSQAIILLSQMKRIGSDNDTRLSNALYLDSKLKGIPGIVPYKPAPGASRAVYHLYPFRYIKDQFNDVPKEKFIRALNAEGIPCSSGYGMQNRDGLIEEALTSKAYRRLFPESRLKQWREENILPGNDKLCGEAVTFSQSMLLGSRSDMDDIINAIAKLYTRRDELAKI